MKKIYLILFSVLIGTQAFSQNTKYIKNKYTKDDYSLNKIKPTNHINASKNVALWSNDFSNPGDWSFTHTTGTGFHNIDWTVSTDPSVVPVTILSPFESTTASNGFLYINSDANNSADDDGTQIQANATIVNPIDLSGEFCVKLEFQHNFRWYRDTRGVRVSGDGGQTWTEYELTNNFDYEDGNYYDGEQNSGNPHITSIDISDAAANSPNVKIQFYYDDHDFWAWYWVVDDVVIRRGSNDDDVKNEFAYVYGSSTNFAEYGRTPLSQLDQEWVIGAAVSNKGCQSVNNVTLNADFGSFNSVSTFTGTLDRDSSETLETIETLSLDVGLYQGTFTVFTDTDTLDGQSFSDNILRRNFEITENVYSLDGIGNHPDDLEEIYRFTSTATQWCADDDCETTYTVDDGLGFGNHYPILNPDTINSVTAFLTDNTVEDAQVILWIIDSTDGANFELTSPLFFADYTLNAEDVANGFITVPVSAGNNNYLAITPGSYYVLLTCYTGGGTYPIGFIDDRTVGQPGWSSALWFPEANGNPAVVYPNGTAWAIRLNLGPDMPSTGIEENSDNISIYPNPSNGIVNITFENNENRTITVRDISGKVVVVKNINTNTVIDFNDYGRGIYLIEITTNGETLRKKVTIQ